MPGGWNSYSQAVNADGPIAWYRFSELLAGSPVTAGSQDPQNLCFDSSGGSQLSTAYSSATIQSQGTGSIALSGTWVGATDTITPTINGVSHLYTTVAGDSTLTTFATNLAANINTQFAGLVTAAASGTSVVLTSVLSGEPSNYTLSVAKSSTSGVATASGASFTGGATYQQGQSDGGGNVLQYGSAVIANAPSLLKTDGPQGDPGGAALFPQTATQALTNMITAGAVTPVAQQPTAAITVAGWCDPAVFVGSSAKQMIVCYGSDATSLAAYSLYHLGSSTSNHQFAFSVNIAGTLKTATATLPILVANTIYYVAGTYDGVNVRIYVNGVLEGTTAATGAISYASGGGLGLAIGCDPSLTDANIQGTLDEVAIYNKALTASRIAYHYRQGSTFLPFPWNH